MISSKALSSERIYDFTAEKIFKAFERGDLLAKWWGPKDFTNTFEMFEFKAGGRWVFTMHAPNGTDYKNENQFNEILPNKKVVIEHIFDPKFILTITLLPMGDKTQLRWVQDFETVELAESLRAMCEPANEQNLDRLQAVLLKLDK